MTELEKMENALRERTRELHEARDYQAATSDLLKVMSRTPVDLEEVLAFVCNAASRLCQAPAASFFRLDGGLYRWAIGVGSIPAAYQAIEEKSELAPGMGSLVGRVALTGKIVHIVDVMKDPHYALKDEARVFGAHSILGVPLLHDGIVIGVICLGRKHIDPFTEQQIRLVNTFSDQAAIAVQSARLYNDLQAAHAAAERERALLHTTLDGLPDAVGLCEADGTIHFVNKALYDLQEIPAGLMAPGTNVRAAYRWQIETGRIPLQYPTIEEQVEATFQQTIASSAGQPVYAQRGGRGGRWLEIRYLRIPNGLCLTVQRDVDTLKRQEEELSRQRDAAEAARRETEAAQSLLQMTIDNMTDGLALVGANGDTIVHNRQIFEINGLPMDAFTQNLNLRDMMRFQFENGHVPRQNATVEADVAAAWHEFVHSDGRPVIRRRPNGNWIERRWIPLPDGRRVVMHRDVTELKRREAELETARDAAEASNHAKSTFLATMSHEIRTPMNGVLGMIDVLEHEGLSRRQRDTVLVIRESATALLRIIDDVLDFSKIEAGHMELEHAAFSLSETIAGVVQALRPQAAAKRLALASAIDPGSTDRVMGDATRVRQVLFNLLGNAIKFTETGRVSLHVGAEPLGGGMTAIRMTVSDTGIGMDAATQARLFAPFSQADSSTTRRFGGTGLGLSIVKRLVELMGGTVGVHSAPGEGATFTVWLMLEAAPENPANPPPESRVPSLSIGRLLIVDDHPINRAVLLRQLRLLGVDADTAEDGAAALVRWRAGRYAALLADIHMPVMDGYALAAAIRAEETGGRTPIVAVTANAIAGEEERCLAAGMDAYLTKPVSIASLAIVLGRLACAQPAIDRDILAGWFGDETAAIDGLLGEFVESAHESLSEIDAALAVGDLRRVCAATHRMTGGALTMGMRELAASGARLEAACEAGNHDEIAPLCAALRGELRRVEAETSRRPTASPRH